MVCQTGVKRQSWNLRYVEKQRVTETNDQATCRTQHQGVIAQVPQTSVHSHVEEK